jgi:hypothetical protein
VLAHAVAQYLRRLALAIDTAMNMSGGLAAAAAAATTGATAAAGAAADGGVPHGAAAGGGGGRSGRGRKQHVADLLLVKARPVYGFYAEEALFIKIVL